jgi:thioredoxin-dependent peroxiredoxin
MAKLAPGAKAPAFTLPDADGNKVSLSDFAGSKVVVYFYPRDDTPGCTKEACQFNDALSQFEGLGIPVIGISPDKQAAHIKFRDKYGLQFPLLSDPDHKVMEKYGAWGEKMMYGKATTGVIRSTFLVDEKGKVARAWYSVKADGHAAKVLEEALSA